jgi:hypothetical protein
MVKEGLVRTTLTRKRRHFMAWGLKDTPRKYWENSAMYGDERRKFVLGALLLVLLAVTLATGWMLLHKRTPGMYGAISLSQSSQGYGAAWGYADPADAQTRAQQECARAGGSNCQVRVSLAGTCGALVMSEQSNQTFAVTDADKNIAGALALAQCQASGASDCAVQANFCGSGS